MFKKGDKVKIVKKIFVWETRGNNNSWIYSMDEYLNKEVTILYVNDYEFLICESEGRFSYPIECAIKIKKINKIKNKLK